jgi:hypothetical protein
MLYVKVGCPICIHGVIGIRRCSDGSTLVLMCDECEAVWLDPTQLSPGSALDAGPPDWTVGNTGAAVAGGKADWASRADISAARWLPYVAGEQL